MNADSKIILERRFVPKGAVVMHQGDDATSAFLIQSGSVRVYTEKSGKQAELAHLGMGQIFGEAALIFDEPRNASVEAVEDCNLIVITRQALDYKLQRSDPTVKALVQMLSRRVESANNAMMDKQNTFDEMMVSVQRIQRNVMAELPRNQQRGFEESVAPKVEELLEAFKAFKNRFQL